MSNGRVLIVEDEVLFAMMVETELSDRGYLVVGIATNAADAVELARLRRPDLVLMDVRLQGDGDGVDAVQRIRAEDIEAEVIFITGSRETATLERMKESRVAGILFKPVGPDEIEQAVRSALRGRGGD